MDEQTAEEGNEEGQLQLENSKAPLEAQGREDATSASGQQGGASSI